MAQDLVQVDMRWTKICAMQTGGSNDSEISGSERTWIA